MYMYIYIYMGKSHIIAVSSLNSASLWLPIFESALQATWLQCLQADVFADQGCKPGKTAGLVIQWAMGPERGGEYAE